MTHIDRDWWIALAALLGTILLGFVVRYLIRRRIASWVTRTSTDLDDLAFAALRGHLPIWFLLAGIVVAARLAPVSEGLAQLTDRSCGLLFSVSLTLVAARLASSWLESYGRRTGAAVGATTLIQHTVRVAIVVVGGLLVLSNLGISVTPLLTALGVGSLAIALALQPTLSNLFAGLHLAVARPIRVGDFVQLETGARGFVVDIGWRATRIRELPNNIIVVPNARIAEMMLTNYEMPEPEQSVVVQVGVAYDSELASVERATIDVAREVVRDVEGGVSSSDPFVRYHTFGDSSIDFSVIMRIRQFTDRYLLTHEFIKRLKARYDRDGIEIPFPQRVVHGRLEAAAGGAWPPSARATEEQAG